MTEFPEGPVTEPVRVVFNMQPEVYERLWVAAADEGADFSAVLNTYVAMYDDIRRMNPGAMMRVTNHKTGQQMVLMMVHNGQKTTRRRLWVSAWRAVFGGKDRRA